MNALPSGLDVVFQFLLCRQVGAQTDFCRRACWFYEYAKSGCPHARTVAKQLLCTYPLICTVLHAKWSVVDAVMPFHLNAESLSKEVEFTCFNPRLISVYIPHHNYRVLCSSV